MLYSVALLCTVGICAWVVLDLIFASTWRRRIFSVAALGVAVGLFAAGDLLLIGAVEPEQVLASRRILFLGLALLGPAWFWSALEARTHGPSMGRNLLVALVAAPSLAIYSALYWDQGGHFFVNWYSRPPQHGPLFFAHAAYSWLLIGVGLALLLNWRPRQAIPLTRTHRSLLVLAAGVPLAANLVFVLTDFPSRDPTPVILGVSGLAMRRVILDMIWGAYYLPFARNEVVEQMETGFVVADQQGLIVDSNAAARRLLGSAALDGQPIHELNAKIERETAGNLEPRGFWLKRGDQPVGAGLLIADRTEKRHLEQQAELATRLEGLGHLAAGVSHEINNPLTYLMVNLDLLEPVVAHAAAQSQAALPPDLRRIAKESPELLDSSREGAERIRRIVEQLAELAMRPDEAADPTSIELSKTIERAKAMALLGQPEAKLRHSLSGDAHAFASERDVTYILLQLLLNAIRETGKEGEVEIRVSPNLGGSAIEVLDDGPGIPIKDLPYVFDPLFTTGRPERLGMGLSLCFQLAKKNGGRVEAMNRPEGGACFRLWLPGEGKTLTPSSAESA